MCTIPVMGEVDELEAAVAAAAATFDVNRLTTTEAVALVPRLTRLLNTVSAMVGLAAARAAAGDRCEAALVGCDEGGRIGGWVVADAARRGGRRRGREPDG